METDLQLLEYYDRPDDHHSLDTNSELLTQNLIPSANEPSPPAGSNIKYYLVGMVDLDLAA